MTCKFCGKEVNTEKYLHQPKGGVSCGQCTSYCTKQCKLGKSGNVQGWHFEPCLSCRENPYKRRIKDEIVV